MPYKIHESHESLDSLDSLDRFESLPKASKAAKTRKPPKLESHESLRTKKSGTKSKFQPFWLLFGALDHLLRVSMFRSCQARLCQLNQARES
jgi:hypothetical protein